MIKIYQINTRTWVWILYDQEGNQLIVSKEFRSEADCFINLERVKLNLSALNLDENRITEGRDENDYPDFVTHY